MNLSLRERALFAIFVFTALCGAVSGGIVAAGSVTARTLELRFADEAHVMDYGAFCDTVVTAIGGTITVGSTNGSPTVNMGAIVPGNFSGSTVVIGLIGTAGLPLRSTFLTLNGTNTVVLNDNAGATLAGADRWAYGHDDQPGYALAKASGASLIQWPSRGKCGIRSTLTVDNARPVIVDFGGSTIVALGALGGSAMVKMPATGGSFWQAIGSQVRNGVLEGMGVANYNIEQAASVQWHIHDLTLLDAAITNLYIHGTALNNDFSELGIYNETYTVPFPGSTGYYIDIATGATDNRIRNVIAGGGAAPAGAASGGVRDHTFGTFYDNVHLYSVHNGPSFDFNGAVHAQNLYADMGASQAGQQGFSITGGFNLLNNYFCYASGTYAAQICIDLHSNASNNVGIGVCEGFDTPANCVVGAGSTNTIYPPTGGDGFASGMRVPLDKAFYGTGVAVVGGVDTTWYCGMGTAACQNSATKVDMPVSSGGTFADMNVALTTAPGGAATVTVTLEADGNPGPSCVITGAAKSCQDVFSTSGVSVGLQSNKLYHVKVVISAAAAATSVAGSVTFTRHAT